MRALLLACLIASPVSAADLQADMLLTEKRVMGALLSDPAKKAEYAADSAAVDADPSKKAAMLLKWRGEAAAFTRDYLAGTPVTKKGATVKEMVGPAEWGYLMTYLRTLSDGTIDQVIKNTIISKIETANEDLKQGDDEEAQNLIKLARTKAREQLTEYQGTGEYKLGLAEAARRKQEAEQAAELAKREAAKNAKEQAEQTLKKGGSTFDGAAPKKEEQPVVVVPPKQDPKPEDAMQKVGLKPSQPAGGERPNLVVGKEPPAPSADANDDDMAELRKMKTGRGGYGELIGKYAPAGGGILGAIIGFLVGGPVGAIVGAAAGAALGFGAKKLLA